MVRRSPAALAALALGVLAACSSDQPTSPGAPLRPNLSVAEAESDEPALQLVVFEAMSIPAGFEAQIAALGGKVERTLAPIGVAYVSGLTPESAATLDADLAVRVVEPETILPLEAPAVEATLDGVEPQSTAVPSTAAWYALQWNMKQVKADQAWAQGKLGSAGVTVGIIDTGLDYTNPDLAGLVDLARSRSFLPTETTVLTRYLPMVGGAPTHPVFDLQSHGTHVGATVSSNAIITAGVTSKVKLVGLKVCRSGIAGLTSTGCPSGATFDALMYAADNGIDVVNMSLGGLFTKSTNGGYEEVVNRVFEYVKERKLTVVVSAGNSNVDITHALVPVLDPVSGVESIVHYPSLYATYCSAPNVICVSATGPTASTNIYFGPFTNPDAKAGYSNYGRNAISVAAPGGTSQGFIWAACPTYRVTRTSPAGVTPATYAGAPYAYCQTSPSGKGGTSMAAPHVTGLAALMVERHGKNPSTVAGAIKKAADDLGETGTDPIYGRGRINVARALGL